VTTTSEFDGQVVFVTGAARGQGRGIATTFAAEGCDVVICDVARQFESNPISMGTEDELRETAKMVEALGRVCVMDVVDVRDLEAVTALAARGIAEFGHIDILASSAGVASFAPIDEMSSAQWRDVIDTNLTGAFNAIRAVSPHMKAQGRGSVVVTSSTQGRSAVGNIASYVTSKWGLIGLVKAAACDLSPFGVRVNAVAPTNVATPMFMNDYVRRLFVPDEEHPTDEQFEEACKLTHPMGVGWVEVEDVVNAYLFLCSSRARNITGAVIDVAAGYNTRYTG
jgi:SDR family mycofactocin-dependent oxidoreductase